MNLIKLERLAQFSNQISPIIIKRTDLFSFKNRRSQRDPITKEAVSQNILRSFVAAVIHADG